jgi:hypothetical protein
MSKQIEELLAEEDDDDAGTLDGEDDADCAFCLGREAAHRGDGEDQNPFPKTDARKGSVDWYETGTDTRSGGPAPSSHQPSSCSARSLPPSNSPTFPTITCSSVASKSNFRS